MKKISKIQWERYKNSSEGQECISLFHKLHSNDCSVEEMLEIAKKFDHDYFKNLSKKEVEYVLFRLRDFIDFMESNIDALSGYIENNRPDDVYFDFLWAYCAEDDNQSFEDIPQSAFKDILRYNILMTTALYAYMPEWFIPNFFVMQFAQLQKFAEKYDIELPPIPNRSDYKARNLYYLNVNNALFNFAGENQIEDAAELCAFIYGYEMELIKEELENEAQNDVPEIPGQAWLLVGTFSEGEKGMTYGFYQANQFTSKGDILLFYEKSPVKALTSVWRAQQDGVVDPFFHFYSNTYIGQKISIPIEQAVTISDFKSSEYFKNRSKEGNFVSKNFQDCCGWAVTRDDYNEIKRMLEHKGYDTSVLPKLYEPQKIGDVTINNEAEVSKKLLIPLLEQMGFGGMYEQEVPFKAGRTETGHSSKKRPDFCLHITRKNDDVSARVVIEVKESMKNDKEIHNNFVQCRSYAKWGNAKVMAICDSRIIRVYQVDNNHDFNEHKFLEYKWHEMENGDKFQELKRLFS